jgi:hypothetical protein
MLIRPRGRNQVSLSHVLLKQSQRCTSFLTHSTSSTCVSAMLGLVVATRRSEVFAQTGVPPELAAM